MDKLKNKSTLATLATIVQTNNCPNNLIKFNEKLDILRLSINKILKYKIKGINKTKYRPKNKVINSKTRYTKNNGFIKNQIKSW